MLGGPDYGMVGEDIIAIEPVCMRCGGAGHARENCRSFKVRLCRHHARGECFYMDAPLLCPYAHGDGEVRNPFAKRCVRVCRSRRDGHIFDLGCGKEGVTYGECCKESREREREARRRRRGNQ